MAKYKNDREAAVKDTVFRNGLAQHGDVQSIDEATGEIKVMRNNGAVETWKAADCLHKSDVGREQAKAMPSHAPAPK